MKDLTEGSVTKHLLHMSAFMAVSMFVQTLYLLADLYWVGSLGKEAIAAVGVAGNLTMIVLALTQMLGVGTTALISQAAGQKNQGRGELVFNQSFIMSILVAVALGLCGFVLMNRYCNSLSADPETARLAKSYMLWFLPALLLQFPLVALASALRATGIVQPTVILQVFSIALNIVLAPFLIFGTAHAWPAFDVVRGIVATRVSLPSLGVTGAALASFVAILVADVLLILYFEKKYRYFRFRLASMRPQLGTWSKILRIGVPAGAEFVLLFVYILIVYALIRGFGPAAQAGFGVGARVMQALFLPVVALSFAASPVVGQNFGGRKPDRVRHAVYSAIQIAIAMMIVLALLAYFFPAPMIRAFSKDPNVVSFGSEYLHIVALNFIAAGIVFTSSSIFQGLGNTLPPLFSSLTRLFLFILPALLLSRMSGFQIRYVWYLSVASQSIQACVNLLLLRRELQHKISQRFTDGVVAPGGAIAG
jgi:putative MATE family efflux protein